MHCNKFPLGLCSQQTATHNINAFYALFIALSTLTIALYALWRYLVKPAHLQGSRLGGRGMSANLKIQPGETYQRLGLPVFCGMQLHPINDFSL